MGAMFEGGYRARNGRIEELCEGESYYDVDWGNCKEPDFWIDVCEDTPENRKKYGIKTTE